MAQCAAVRRIFLASNELALVRLSLPRTLLADDGRPERRALAITTSEALRVE